MPYIRLIMPFYNWQQPDWPQFHYDAAALGEVLFRFAQKSGYTAGLLSTLSVADAEAVLLQTLIAEAIKTSEIEGEFLSRKDVYSSIQHHLHPAGTPPHITDRRAADISALVVDVRNTYAEPLTKEKLGHWHRMLFENSRLKAVGTWRQGPDPMRVVSGTYGRETVHFEAPPANRVPAETDAFIQWFNDTAPAGKSPISAAPVRAAIAHLYFESIHPFEDGNGRIGRALAEKALAQTLGAPILLSLSNTLRESHAQYYLDLQSAQQQNEITEWIRRFTETLIRAQEVAAEWITFILRKAKFYDTYRSLLNARQLKAIERMLEEGPSGFEGGMNATKYGSLTGASKATATRDLQDLLEIGAVVRLGESGGRSTRYGLNI